MSTSVDERVVAMKFDNKQFESGTKTTLSTLDKLKQGLNLSGASKGLENVGSAASKVSLSGLASGVDAIGVKFSALQVMAVTALANITNSAISAGTNLVKSLTIDPIKEGFQEYEAGLNAFQTILANTKTAGATTNDINKVLAVLNDYANKTIYSFGDMTKAVGLFTAQGVNLKDSVTGIKGIFNIVSLTGGDADKANSAIYQLSQAIASGTVKAQDWISVVNAGIGGTDFQNQLKQTARVHGIAVDKMIKKTGSFKDSLKSGWLTSQVLLETLSQYGGDMTDQQLKSLGYTAKQIKQIQELGKTAVNSATKLKSYTQLLDTLRSNVVTGWATSFKTIIGSLDEAAKLWTTVGDSIGGTLQASADARNKMLTDWKALGGRTVLIQAIGIAFTNLSNIVKSISSAFREVFPATTGKQLYAMTVGLKNLVSGFTMSKGSLANLKTTFSGLFAVLDIGKQIFTAVVKAIWPMSGGVGDLGGGILSLTASIGKWLISLDNTIKKNDIIGKSLHNIGTLITFVKDEIGKAITGLTPFVTTVKNVFASVWNSINGLFAGTTVFGATLDGTKDSLSSTASGVDKFKMTLEKVHDVMSKIGKTISNVAKAVYNVLAPVFKFISDKIKSISMGDVGALLTGGGFLLFAKTLAKGLESINGITENFAKVIGEVGNTLKAFQLKIKADALFKIALALGILALALIALSFIDIVSLGKSLGILSLLMTELVVAMIILNKQSAGVGKISSMFNKIGNVIQLMGLALAMLVLAGAIKIISTIPMAQLAQGIGGIAALLLIIGIFIKGTKGGSLKTSAGGLTAFAVGILILTGALAILGKLKPATLIQGTEAIVALMLMIAIFVKGTEGGDLIASAGGLTGFALGITILAGALAILGKMKMQTLIQGASAITALMLVIAVFINTTKEGDLFISAGGLVAFAVGITILCGALSILGHMKIANLIQGGIAIAGLMDVIATFIMVTRGGDLIASSAGIIGFAIGITILCGAVKMLGSLKSGKVIQGVLAISSLITVIGLFIDVTNGADLATSSAGMIGFAFGLTLLAGAVAILAAIKSSKIVQGVGAITALMLTIGIFVNITKGGDLALTSAGLTAFAIGLSILAGVLAILSALDATKLLMASGAISALMLSIGLFINLTSMGDLIASSAGLVVFAGAILVLSKVIIALGEVPFMTLVKGIGALAAILVIIGLTSVVLAPFIPTIVALAGAIGLFGLGCLMVAGALWVFANALNLLGTTGPAAATNIGNSATAIGNAFLKVLSAILNAIIVATPQIMKTIGGLLTSLLTFLVTNIPLMVNAGAQLILGILAGISDNIGKIINAAFVLVISFINGLANAIRNNSKAINLACLNLVDAIVNGIASFGSSFVEAGANAVKGFIKGLLSLPGKLWDAATSIGKDSIHATTKAINAHSPSREFFKLGGYSTQGFINGLLSLGSNVASAATNVGTGAINSMSNAISGISDLVNNGIDSTPTIRPVFDLSNIQNGSKQLYSMMDGLDGYAMAGSIDVANGTAKSIQTNQTTAFDNANAKNTAVGNSDNSTSNVFNIQGSSPKEIAVEVSSILQKQVERRQSAWA